MSKKWTLDEHLRDIEDWESDRGNLFANKDRMFFVAYERWLNDRDLLTLEDGYEWRSALIAPLDLMSASEKLKALEFTAGGTARNPDSMYDLLAALPQIVAVVGAAEKGKRYTNRDLERPFGGDRSSWMETEALDAALTALNEALS